MGYTHFEKVSGKTGLGVGKKGSEIVVANSSGNLFQAGTQVTSTAAEINARSEERRVGKECRSRWSPYH